MYAVVGIAAHDVTKIYINQLDRELTMMGFRHFNLKPTIVCPLWVMIIIVGLETLFWPATLITCILKAEWEYSKLTQPYEKESV